MRVRYFCTGCDKVYFFVDEGPVKEDWACTRAGRSVPAYRVIEEDEVA